LRHVSLPDPGRWFDQTSCYLVLTLMQCALFGGLVVLVSLRGRPGAWRPRLVLGFALACVASAAVWAWIDKPTEGEKLLRLSATHSVTAADLLALPALVAAGAVVVSHLIARKSPDRDPQPEPSADARAASVPERRGI
jgi:hypothetical protein